MPKDSNETSRDQMPVFVHLKRMGYDFFGKTSEESADSVHDLKSNNLVDVFKECFCALYPGHEGEFAQLLKILI